MKRILLLMYLLASTMFAQKAAFNLEKDDNLYAYAQFTNTGDTAYSLEEILTSEALIYTDLISENQSLGFTSEYYWVRFKLQSSSDQSRTYYLETARPITDVVDLYQLQEDGVLLVKSGDQIPFGERQVDHRQSVFRIELPANVTREFYLHLKSDGESLNLPLNVYNEFEFLLHNYEQQLFLGLFYGVLFLAGIIYLFFYTSLRETTFLYYGLYVFSIGLMQAALDGFLFQYIFSDGGYLNSRMVLITALFSNFFLLKYCESFFNIKISLPHFKKAYNIIYVVIGLLFISLFIDPKVLAFVYPISNINGLCSLIVIVTSLFTLRYKRVKIDPYFSGGIFFLVIGLLGFVLNNMGLIPNNFYTLNSAKFGTGFEVIFLSLSMTNLLRVLRQEKETSQEIALQKSEEISELKTFFMSNISHELRTPINAIIGVVEAEMDTEGYDAQQRESLGIIKNASFSLLSSVNDVLDFERIEKNELTLRPTTFNPVDLLQQVSNNWKLEAHKKGLAYEFDIDKNTPKSVSGDADRFVQIINNVLGNALKFTNKGAISSSLYCDFETSGTCHFTFRIVDTGVGMDELGKKEVYNSFNQMRRDHKRKFGGVGLGLTIVQHLIYLFQGTIEIESELDKGTEVTIEFPLEIVAQQESITQFDNVEYHVLVVEDNKLNQLVMKKILSSAPAVTFDIANNGQEALDMIRNTEYDLILMDLQMPIMDGYEATKKIRSGVYGDFNMNIPIIAVTADALEETRKHVLEIGMNDYTTKPVNRETLFNKINHCRVTYLQASSN